MYYGVKFYFGPDMGWMFLTDGLDEPIKFKSEDDADKFVKSMYFENNKYTYDVVEIKDDF